MDLDQMELISCKKMKLTEWQISKPHRLSIQYRQIDS